MWNFLGINDDHDNCECCGKVGLKRVVYLENEADGTIAHFGTTCAAYKMTGKKHSAKKAEKIIESMNSYAEVETQFFQNNTLPCALKECAKSSADAIANWFKRNSIAVNFGGYVLAKDGIYTATCMIATVNMFKKNGWVIV